MIKFPPESAKQYLIDQDKYLNPIYFIFEIISFVFIFIFTANVSNICLIPGFMIIISFIHAVIANDIGNEHYSPLTIGRIPIYIQAITTGWLNQSRITEATFNKSIEEYESQTKQIIKLQQEIFALEQKQFDDNLKKSLKGDALDWRI